MGHNPGSSPASRFRLSSTLRPGKGGGADAGRKGAREGGKGGRTGKLGRLWKSDGGVKKTFEPTLPGNRAAAIAPRCGGAG